MSLGNSVRWRVRGPLPKSRRWFRAPARTYAIARRSFGDDVNFVVGWADWISLCGAVAATALVAGEYFHDLFRLGPSIIIPALGVVGAVTLVGLANASLQCASRIL